MSRDRRVGPGFAAASRDAEKVLAIEIAGLGDLVHSLPALWALRQGYPEARLDCIVQEQVASFLQMVPWIDRVIPYRRRPKGSWRYQLDMARSLRAERYDVAVDLIGANRSAAIARISGAPRRLIRRPGRTEGRWGWDWCSTHVMDRSYGAEPMYLQRLLCVRQAGFLTSEARFNLAPVAEDRFLKAAMVEATRGYIHISPCTKLMSKELSPEQMIELIIGLHEAFPEQELVVSCSTQPREREATRRILEGLPFRPWKVFDGTLDVPQLFSLIRGAALHVGGDTGTVHLAWLAGTPSASWFRDFEKHRQWAPQGPQHAFLISPSRSDDYLRGIDTARLIAYAADVIGWRESAAVGGARARS